MYSLKLLSIHIVQSFINEPNAQKKTNPKGLIPKDWAGYKVIEWTNYPE